MYSISTNKELKPRSAQLYLCNRNNFEPTRWEEITEEQRWAMKVKVKHIETRSLTRFTQYTYIYCFFIHTACVPCSTKLSQASRRGRRFAWLINVKLLMFHVFDPPKKKKTFPQWKITRQTAAAVQHSAGNKSEPQANDVVVREKLPCWGDKLTMKVQHFSMLSSPTQSPSLLVKLERRQLSQQRTDCAVHHLNRDEFQVSSVVGWSKKTKSTLLWSTFIPNGSP